MGIETDPYKEFKEPELFVAKVDLVDGNSAYLMYPVVMSELYSLHDRYSFFKCTEDGYMMERLTEIYDSIVERWLHANILIRKENADV